MPSMRFRVIPRDVPPVIAARRLGMTLDQFQQKLPELRARRPAFPAADPTTGNFDLEAIEAWMNARHPQIFTGQTISAPVDGTATTRDRLRSMA